MGNWIRSYVKAEGVKSLPIFSKEGIIDFNLIVPEPACEKECPEEYLYKEDNQEHIVRSEERPWYNWAKWRREHWGVYTNAWSCDLRNDQSDVTFDTKSGAAIPIAAKISKILGTVQLTYEYVDIDNLGSPIIRTIWKDGKLVGAESSSFIWNMDDDSADVGEYGPFIKEKVENLPDYFKKYI